MSAPRLPHFVIIGAMKSATTTLQEQLVQQPGIFMCTPKEPNFFSDESQFRKGMSWYEELFSAAPTGALLGEASTHYSKLPTYPLCAERLHRHLPGAKLIYVMRHPVDRLISHYIHEWSMGNINCSLNDAVAMKPEMTAYSEYTMQLSPYFQRYGSENVLPVFFDRLIREPQTELERVCQFIGYPHKPSWIADLKPANVSSERLRKFPFYSLVVESKPATWLRRNLIPRQWRDRVKAKLTMQQRPELSPEVRSELETIFNRDLSTLGKWLGKPIDCANFKEATSRESLNWVAARA